MPRRRRQIDEKAKSGKRVLVFDEFDVAYIASWSGDDWVYEAEWSPKGIRFDSWIPIPGGGK